MDGYELLEELDGDEEEGLGGHEKEWEGEVVGGVWVKMREGEEIDDGLGVHKKGREGEVVGGFGKRWERGKRLMMV